MSNVINEFQVFPDALTGRPSPGGTGFNLYHDGHVVFAGTLGRESLARVLAFLETTCEPAGRPECQHRWFFDEAALPHVSCSRCGEKYPPPEPKPCSHCDCKSCVSRGVCCKCGEPCVPPQPEPKCEHRRPTHCPRCRHYCDCEPCCRCGERKP